MKLFGKCDFCGTVGEWEGGIWHDRGKNFSFVKNRPKHWAAAFPWNRRKLPEGCTFRPMDLVLYKVTTRLACPDCMR